LILLHQYFSDGVTLPLPVIDHGIDLHRAKQYRAHILWVSRMFRPGLANEDLNLRVV
jgi:hypothetical protein